jgi:hypothetical protein
MEIWAVIYVSNKKLGVIMKTKLIAGIMAVLFIVSTSVILAAPKRDVSFKKHPNIAAAQVLVEQAFKKISAAQRANEFDMDGHAAKAKDLLEQANSELKQAAEAANKHEHRK